jgi:hypothetical protein
MSLNPHHAQRLRRGAVLLCSLPPRITFEFLAELAAKTDAAETILDMLDDYSRLTPEVAQAVGADRFPPSGIRLVPDRGAA